MIQSSNVFSVSLLLIVLDRITIKTLDIID